MVDVGHSQPPEDVRGSLSQGWGADSHHQKAYGMRSTHLI